MPSAKPDCFIIMPYGRRKVGSVTVDFNKTYSEYYALAVDAAGFNPVRCDEDAAGGLISPQMFKWIAQCPIAIADLTGMNPNVCYELGLRHALAKYGTVVTIRTGGKYALSGGIGGKLPAFKLPFDMQDVATVKYELDKKTMGAAVGALTDVLRAAYANVKTDSPAFTHMPGLVVKSGPVRSAGRQDRTYEVLRKGRPTGKFVGYRSGDIGNLRAGGLGGTFDFWVSSENTMMQMARMHERAVSATVRHLGSWQPDANKPGYEDTIQDALSAAMRETYNASVAPEGEVLATTSGKLAQTHYVKAILHAAAVTGSPGELWQPISDSRMQKMVHRCIDLARELSRGEGLGMGGRSMIMPIFGAGQAQRDPSRTAGLLLSAAIDALRDAPASAEGQDIDVVMFSTFSGDDARLMERLCEWLASGDAPDLLRRTRRDAAEDG